MCCINIRKAIYIFAIAAVSMQLFGCGGGGGSGDVEPDPLVYTGNTNAAAITTNNAAVLVNNIVVGSYITGTIGEPAAVSTAPPESIGLVNMAFNLRNKLYMTHKPEASIQQSYSVVTAVDVNETLSCTNGGSMHFSGNLNNDGTGILNIDFDNCREDNDTIDGLVRFQIDEFDMWYLEPTDATMSFSILTIIGPTYSYSASGSLRIELEIASNIEQMTINMVTKDNFTSSMMKQENLVLVLTYDNIFFPTYYSMIQTGRVYDFEHGYVDVTTPEALLYSNTLIEYPDQGGQLLLSGAVDSKIKMIAASIQKVRIEIDAEGNDSFDEYMVYYWTDIGGEIAPNEPPDVSSIVIHPDNPYTTDSLIIDISMVKDPDADPLNYSFTWYKNGVTIAAQTSSTLPDDQYIKGDVINVEVMVSDGALAASITDTVTILNSPPVVNAGTDMNITFADEPQLEGGMSDADNDSLASTWSIISQPFDGNAIFSDNSVLDPFISYTGQDDYMFELSVSDGESTSTDTVNITVDPMPLFNPYVTIDLPSSTESAAIGDVNDDGFNDVVVTTSYAFDPDNDSHIFVLLQDASGNLGSPIKYSVGLLPTQYQIKSTAIADMNNDGKDDVVISYENGVGVMLQNAQGSLNPIAVYTSNHLSFSNTYKVVAADLNGDGLNDIASIDWGSQSEDVDIFLQNNSAILNPPVSYTAPHGGYDDLAYGDVNGDNLNDIVVMSGQGYLTDNLSILIQQSDNTFGAAVTFDLGFDENSNAVGVGDVNGDNLDDVVLAYGGNKPSSNIAIFYQNAGGTLNTPISLLSYDSPGAVEIADINGDGRKDIAVGHPGWHAVGIYLQKPDGMLMGEQRFPFSYSNTNTHRMAVGDINGDGLTDIVEADGVGISILYQ